MNQSGASLLHFCSQSVSDWYLRSTSANYLSSICSKPICSDSDSNVTQKKIRKGSPYDILKLNVFQGPPASLSHL